MTDYTPTQRRLVLVAAIAASSMGFIDGSVISIITPAIRSTLGASLADVQWVSNAYLLTLSCLLLLGGAAGDRYGLRNVFAAGIVLFVVASLGAAVAPSAGLLIAARAVQGIGAAFMVPGSLAIIAEAYPKDQRGGAIGLWAAASSLTTLLGPVLGGLLLSWLGEASWRWVFAINLPLGIVALALLLATPSRRPAGEQRLDLIGAVLAGAALLLISWAFVDPAAPFAWVLGAGVAVLLAFLVWEARAQHPMLPLGLFRERRFAGAQLVTFLIYYGLAAITFYLPMVMITGWGTSPFDVAIAMLPFGIVLTVLSTPAGRLTDRLGPGPVIASGGVLVAVAFAGLGFTVSLHAVWFAVLPLMVVFGLGMSGIAGPISTAVMGAVKDGETGTASAINNAVARVAGLLAVAMMGMLAVVVFGFAAPSGATLGVVPATSLDSALEVQRVTATDAAFAAIAFASAILALAGAVLSWLTLEHRSS